MEIKKVGVLGCGLMGSGIAQVCAMAGFDVTVLEVGGTISFFGKTPTPDSSRHQELLTRFDKVAADLAALQKAIVRSPS